MAHLCTNQLYFLVKNNRHIEKIHIFAAVWGSPHSLLFSRYDLTDSPLFLASYLAKGSYKHNAHVVSQPLIYFMSSELMSLRLHFAFQSQEQRTVKVSYLTALFY